MQSPFLGYGRVVTGDRFVGRGHELAFLSERLGASSIGIVGLPKIGKTSLVKEALRRRRLRSEGVEALWIDVSTHETARDLLISLAEETLRIYGSIVSALTAHKPSGGPETTTAAYRGLKSILREVHLAGHSVTAILDEFDTCKNLKDGPLLVRQLRELIYCPDELGFSIVFVSRRSLNRIDRLAGDGSTLDGTCESLYLRPMKQPDVGELICRLPQGTSWRDEDCDRLWEVSGGHPYIAEMLLDGFFASGDLESGILLHEDRITRYYGEVEALFFEEDLFGQLLQLSVGPAWSVSTTSLAIFRQYGVLEDARHRTNTDYRAWSSHFQEFLEYSCVQPSTWSLWTETETAIREVVDRVLAREYGTDWDTGGTTGPDIAAFVSSWTAKKKTAIGRGYTTKARTIDFSYPMELYQIIAKHWELFRSHFGKTKSYWNEKFELLASVRTALAHSNQASERHRALANAYCHELLEVLGVQSAGHDLTLY